MSQESLDCGQQFVKCRHSESSKMQDVDLVPGCGGIVWWVSGLGLAKCVGSDFWDILMSFIFHDPVWDEFAYISILFRTFPNFRYSYQISLSIYITDIYTCIYLHITIYQLYDFLSQKNMFSKHGSFQEEPIASGSVGQVHRARLRAEHALDGPGSGWKMLEIS